MKLSFLAYFFYIWQESTVNHKSSLNTKFQTTSGVLLIKPQQIQNVKQFQEGKTELCTFFKKNVFENILNLQISAHFFTNKKLVSAEILIQYTVFKLCLKKIRKALDKCRNYTALLTDLSKGFDYIPHDLIIAKLHAYSFNMPLLKLMNSYLTNTHQTVKINTALHKD